MFQRLLYASFASCAVGALAISISSILQTDDWLAWVLALTILLFIAFYVLMVFLGPVVWLALLPVAWLTEHLRRVVRRATPIRLIAVSLGALEGWFLGAEFPLLFTVMGAAAGMGVTWGLQPWPGLREIVAPGGFFDSAEERWDRIVLGYKR